MPRPGPRTINQYSESFKATAVQLSLLPNVAIKDVAESLCIHPFMLSRWRKQVRDGVIVAKAKNITKANSAELQELKQLKIDHEQLKFEHDLLKKAIAFTSARKTISSPLSSTAKDKGSR